MGAKLTELQSPDTSLNVHTLLPIAPVVDVIEPSIIMSGVDAQPDLRGR